MLEILGEVVYKAVAYRRVADAVERFPEDVAARYRAGTPPKVPGAGDALSAKLAELAETGALEYHARLRAQVPSGLLDMLRVQGVGPRTVKLLHDELGISTIDELRAAAEDGTLRGLRGLSARTEANILDGIARIERRSTRLLLHDADALVAGLLHRLRQVNAVRRIEPAGSLRRRRSTIGDLDLLAAVDSAEPLFKALEDLLEVDRVLAAGTDKTSILMSDGPQVDLMVCPPADWGTHLVHFTGSKDHNVALRGRALDRGLSLSEKGFKVVETGELQHVANEEEVYARLDLPWIPPELREDDGEIQAALAGSLPILISPDEVRGDTHTHSDWTDGVDSIEVMARAARDLGREYIVLTDHSPALGITRGLTPDRVAEQRSEGIVNRREPMTLDWPRVFEAAARTGTLLEMNGSPRLDLDEHLGRAAARAGARLTVASDAHRTEELGQVDYAVSVARRAWLSAEQVANTRSATDLLGMLA